MTGKLRIRYSSIYCFILLTPLVRPAFFGIVPWLNIFYNFALWGVGLFCIGTLFFNRRLPKASYLLGMSLWTVAVTIVRNGQVGLAFRDSLPLISLIAIFELFKEDIWGLIKSAYYYLEFYLYLNLVSVILRPDGLFSRYNEAYGYTQEYLLSSKNFFVFWMVPALLLGLLLKNHGYFKWRYVFFSTAMLMNQVFWGSSTGLVAVVIFLVMANFPFKQVFFNPIYLMLTNIGLSLAAFFGARIAPLAFVVENVLGKNLTFTNRNRIWENAFLAINRHKFLGHGFMPAERIAYILGDFGGGFTWLGATHAHNHFLQVAFQSGLIGLGCFMIHIMQIIKTIYKNIGKKAFQICSIGLFVYTLVGLTEYFSFVMIHLCILVPLYLDTNRLEGDANE